MKSINKIVFLFFTFLLMGSFAHYPEWKTTRKLNNDEKVKFSLILENENLELLKDKFNNISNPYNSMYGKYMTFDEINNIINPKHNYW
jgi:subtilase family serine protease